MTLRETASAGTLIDLSSWCLDILRAPVDTSTPTKDSPPLAYDPTTFRALARQTLETTLVLAASQMALLLAMLELPAQNKQARARSELLTI